MTTESQKAFEEANDAFEDWNPLLTDSIMPHTYAYRVNQRKPFVAGYQASRQHIIDKLQSEEMVERVTEAVAIAVKRHIAIHSNGQPVLDDASAVAKAAIAAVLEGM